MSFSVGFYIMGPDMTESAYFTRVILT
jgi:hypothetical protein